MKIIQNTQASVLFALCLVSGPVFAWNYVQDSGTQGIVSMEAENEHASVSNGNHNWKFIYDPAPGYSDTRALKAKPDNGTSNPTGFVGVSPRFDLRVEFAHTGTHYVWIRGSAPDADGNELHVGLNGAAESSADNITIPSPWDQANWSDGSHTLNVNSTGSHNISVWMGEDGVIVDKVVLTTDPNYTPTGQGPAESGIIGHTGKWDSHYVLPETTGNTIDVLANDTHTESETFTLTSVQQKSSTYGSLTINGAGTALIYDAPIPDTEPDKTIQFDYTVIDASGRPSEGNGVIHVTDNNFPVAMADTFTVGEDSSSNALDVLANDTDADGDSLTVSYLWGVTNGATVTINATSDGVDFTPATGFTGTAEFTYKITDGGAGSYSYTTVTVNVVATGSNQAPVAQDDYYSVDQDTSNHVLAVLTGAGADSDPDSDPLTITAVSTPNNGGTANINGTSDGLVYTPVSSFVGTEVFTYTISDGNGGTDTANVTVTVNSTNTAPVAVDDAYTVNQDTSNHAFAVLTNDTDANGDTLSVTSVGATDNGGAAVVNGTNDGITYTPAASFVGTETFIYTADDGNGGSDTATVTVTVDAVAINQPPVLSATGPQSVAEGATLNVSITASDPDGPSPLTLSETNTLPGNPSVLTDHGSGSGTLSWTPTVGDAANSPYTVTVTATDGFSQTDVEVVTITVTEPLVVTYTHNALGQRVTKTEGSNVTHYVYDQVGQLIAEIDGATGNTLREYVYVNGEQLAVIDDTDTAQEAMYFVQNDHLGTPQQIADENETVVWSADYAPFGEVDVQTSVIENTMRFPGQYADQETGLRYNYFRTYDPSIGRYTQSDPIGLRGGLNTYAYARSNTYRYSDPFGLDVFVGSHEVIAPWGGTGSRHAAVLIIPDDQVWAAEQCDRCQLGADSAGIASGRYWTTISGGPNNRIPFPGRLRSTPNRPGDEPWSNTGYVLVNPNIVNEFVCLPRSDQEFIEDLLSAEANYSPVNYDFYPEAGTNGYNSNSFTTGVIEATGATAPSLGPNFPGGNKPVPAEAFGN